MKIFRYPVKEKLFNEGQINQVFFFHMTADSDSKNRKSVFNAGRKLLQEEYFLV